jgi:diguanylate cyclase (GGDEF)-like protein
VGRARQSWQPRAASPAADGRRRGLSVTASIGVATTDDPTHIATLVRSADQRLYEAKRAGRDRVVGEDREGSVRPAGGEQRRRARAARG